MKKFSPAPAFLWGALVFLFISGCNLLGKSDPKLVESITLDKETLTLAVGGTAQLTATVGPSDADNRTVAWASISPGIARVSDTGLVTAVAAGSTIITATTRDGTNKTADCTVTVTGSGTYTVTAATGITGGSISVNPPSGTAGTTITVTLSPASGYQLKAGTLKYNDGTTDHTISGTSFTLPAANVTVSAEFEAITYNVTVKSDITNGSISVNPASGTAGTTITVTNTPASGYQLKAGTLKYNDGTDHPITGNTFALPAAHVTVSAEFEVIPPTYTVTAKTGLTNGTLRFEPASGPAGTTIEVIPEPASGYQFKAGTLKYNDGTDHPISGDSFTLPAANVTVSAEFEAITYTVTAVTVTGGSISVNPTSGTAGTTITVTPTPARGYQFKAGTIKYNDGTDHAISGTTFVLPAANVTVSAEFELTGTALEITFAGIGNEEIGLSPDTPITLSKSNYDYDYIIVSVTEVWDSVNWYVDGSLWSYDTQIGLYASSYPVGKHTATATVKKGSAFYSKTLHFEVVR